MGSTDSRGFIRAINANHSHVCGINGAIGMFPLSCTESFPRMWDQLHAISEFRQFVRIIPTYVGSTSLSRRICIRYSNHSHVCGINVIHHFALSSFSESFPRMWDQQRNISITVDGDRIIPTYVGSTYASLPFSLYTSNHSHVCGINPSTTNSRPQKSESFPRMWDQLVENILAADVSRIIPTYVGSTFFVGSVFKFDANHSHVCGINECSLHGCTEFDESFPRMWDQLLFLHYINHGIRIIPTYVGSTRGFKNLMQITTNHSHVCGINA